MQFRFSSFVVTIAVGLVIASSASAASVNWTLDLSANDGTFGLFADATGADNFGLASYNVLLTGAIDSVDHASPNIGTARNDASTQFGPAAFTGFRSADGNTAIGASQETLNANAFLIHGMGQTADSFANLGITALTAVTDPVAWDASLLIATGTYTGAREEVGFDEQSVEVFNNVFGADTGAQVIVSDFTFEILLEGGGGETDPPVIDPLEIHVDLDLRRNPTLTLPVEQQLAASDATEPIDWSDLSYSGPGKAGGGADATLGTDGLFSWDPTGWRMGLHEFSAVATDGAGNATGSTLSLTVDLWVPEPATLSLFGLALVGLAGIRRRR